MNATNRPANLSVQDKLSALDQQIRRRASFVTSGYSVAFVGGIGLFVFFPFQLSRIGSLVLIVALAQMMWSVFQASREAVRLTPLESEDPSMSGLGRIDAQIRLGQSLIYH